MNVPEALDMASGLNPLPESVDLNVLTQIVVQLVDWTVNVMNEAPEDEPDAGARALEQALAAAYIMGATSTTTTNLDLFQRLMREGEVNVTIRMDIT